MAIKKKTTLRAKSARVNKKPQIVNKLPESNYEENPFLKLSTVTKKEKQLTKAKNFNDRIVNTGQAISKSALRRRKRKAREALKPKMEDLFESLPTISPGDQEQKFIEQKEFTNKPNFTKKSGHQVIFKEEHQNFNAVISNQEFRKSPFATLKNAIQNQLNKN